MTKMNGGRGAGEVAGGRGRRGHLRLSRRRRAADLRRAVRREEDPARSCRGTSRAPTHAADGYARATGKRRRRARHERSRRDEHGHRHRERLHGLDPDGGLHRRRSRRTCIGTDAFQEADITGITIPITKHNYLVKDAADLPEVIKEAFHIATTGRPGPVLIDMPVGRRPRASSTSSYPETREPARLQAHVQGPREADQAGRVDDRQGAQAAAVRRAAACSPRAPPKELKELAELMQLPVTTTLMGKGAFPEDHHLFLGMPGMHGAKYTNYAHHRDRPAHRRRRALRRPRDRQARERSRRKAKVIHIDIDPAEIGKNRPVDVPIVGDAKSVLAGIVAELRKTGAEPRTERVDARHRRLAQALPAALPRRATDALMPQYVVAARRRAHEGPRRRSSCTEVGQNQMWACQYYTGPRAAHAGSPRAASARWASACRPPSARSWAGPDAARRRHRRRRLASR